MAALVISLAVWPTVGAAQSVREVVETYAKSAVDEGTAIGVAVGVTMGGRRQFFAYGLADVARRTRATPDTIFQIGSVTKIFTTAILGQNTVVGMNSLAQSLGDFTAQLGSLPTSNQPVTLEELADFTAGLPSDPPSCGPSRLPGCLPNPRPTIDQYTAQDFAAYFSGTYAAPSQLPAPFFYSDISIGILGLLLGADPGGPLSNAALSGWLDLVSTRITEPLDMKDTFLAPATPKQQRRLASGYTQALARATVSSGGQVSEVDLVSGGSAYTTPPAVVIRGGGGAGARAQASLEQGQVLAIDVTNPGRTTYPRRKSCSAAGTRWPRRSSRAGASSESGSRRAVRATRRRIRPRSRLPGERAGPRPGWRAWPRRPSPTAASITSRCSMAAADTWTPSR